MTLGFGIGGAPLTEGAGACEYLHWVPCGLKLELMELVCRFPYVAILCSIDMIIYDLEPLNGIVLGKNMFDKVV